MIEYSDIKDLGFKKVEEHDSVYELRYGRKYSYMEFICNIECKGYSNEIIMNWDCDALSVKVFVNEKFARVFNEFDGFISFFDLFIDRNKDN